MAKKKWVKNLAVGREDRIYKAMRTAVTERRWCENGMNIGGQLFRCESKFSSEDHTIDLVFPTPLGTVIINVKAAPASIEIVFSCPDNLPGIARNQGFDLFKCMETLLEDIARIAK